MSIQFHKVQYSLNQLITGQNGSIQFNTVQFSSMQFNIAKQSSISLNIVHCIALY